VAFSPDGRLVLTGSDDGVARLWDVSTQTEIRPFTGPGGRLTAAALSADGRDVFTLSLADRTARTWDRETGQQVRAMLTSVGVFSSAFSPNGALLLTGDYDVPEGPAGSTCAVRLWDAGTGQQLRCFSGSGSNISALAFSPDGRYGLSVANDNVVRVWDLKTGEQVRAFTGHTDLVWAATFSPDGRFVLTGSSDHTARLWDIASGTLVRSFSDHASPVTSVAFAPDGKTILTGHDDDHARLWDVNSGRQLRDFIGHTAWITSVAFSPDGRYVLTGSADGTARLWDTDYHDTIRYACSLLSHDFTEEERTQYSIADGSPTCLQP
jgi:WD40 repeat protein